MTAMLDWLSGPAAESLCLTLLHSLWQGAAWCALLLVVLRCIRSDRPELRYAVVLTCLYGLLGGACVTWSILRQPTTEDLNAPLGQTIMAASNGANPATGASPAAVSESVPTPRSTTPSSATAFKLAHLTPWIVSIWGTGACLCLLMSSRHIATVRRFQAGKPIDDPEANRLLDKLIAMLGIARTVRLLSVENLAVPGVIGILKPAILIPSSLVTGLTPDQWEAILAHELAHIRRWDYLVNLSQLVIESVLFFNPAVWWLSRQVRLEREACCDAAAVRVTAQPFQYVTLLVSLAEGLGADAPVAPAVGFSREHSGSLLERVRRVVTPGWRSELRMNRPVAVAFLVLGLAAIVLLQAGADVAVKVAARILSDEERVEELSETAKEVGLESNEKLTIRGTIEFEREKPERQFVTISNITRHGENIRCGTLAMVDLAKTDEFNETTGPGITCLQFSHPDFAETQLGPFGANDGPEIRDVHVVLRKGIDVPVVVVDDQGLPVPDAQIRATPTAGVGGGGSTFRNASMTDESGKAVLAHINPDLQYSLSATAPGFQKIDPPTQRLAADTPLRLEMLHAQSTRGIVVNQRGEPIAGATLKRLRLRRPKMTNYRGNFEPPLTATDTDGRFLLTELEDQWTYDLLVEAEGHAPTILANVHPGDTGLQATMGPAIAVRGTIRGPAEQLEKLKRGSPIHWQLRFPKDDTDNSHDRLAIRGRQGLELKEGVGGFTLPPLAQGELVLEVGDLLIRTELTESIGDFQIDLSKDAMANSPDMPAKRLVRITFTRDGEPVSPQGAMGISSRKPGEDAHTNRSYLIEDGAVEAEFYVGNRLLVDGKKMIGFWFAHHPPTAELAPGQDPFEIEIPVRPAGAVKGVVVDSNGAPVADVGASVHYRLETRGLDNFTSHSSGCNARTNSKGEFFLSPIPFGAKCSVKASRDKYVAVGGEFELGAENALPEFTIRLDLGVNARLRLLDPSGAPLAGFPVGLACRHPSVSQSWGPPELTDRHGECRFQQLNPEFEGHYVANLEFTKDCRPATVPLKLNGETTVFRAERGKVIEGTLLDAQGRPLESVQLVARSVDWKPKGELLFRYSPEAKTDSQGRFRFSNLPAAKMIVCEETWPNQGKRVMPVDADQVQPVTVRKPD